jgi:hypothetical protein
MKFSMDDFDNYSKDSVGFFSLKNDGDSCRVRILYESTNDIEGDAVHKVRNKDGIYVNVSCLRSYNDPACNCPLCSSPNFDDRKIHSKIWVPLQKVDTGELVLWERGKAFYKDTLLPMMIEKGKPFCGNVFTVERHGAAGDVYTKYEVVWEGFDDTVLDDFEDIPKSDLVILNKTFEELEKFVKTRTFDGAADSSYNQNNNNGNTRGNNNYNGRNNNNYNGNSDNGGYRRRGVSRPNTYDE